MLLCDSRIHAFIVRYLYFYERKHPQIHERYITGLITLTNEQLGPNAQQSPSIGLSLAHSSQSNIASELHFKNLIGKILFLYDIHNIDHFGINVFYHKMIYINLYVLLCFSQHTFVQSNNMRRVLPGSIRFKSPSYVFYVRFVLRE